MYYKYDVLKKGTEYVKLIKNQLPNHLKQNSDTLTTIEKAENSLVFLDIEKLRDIEKFKKNFISMLETCE